MKSTESLKRERPKQNKTPEKNKSVYQKKKKKKPWKLLRTESLNTTRPKNKP